MKKILGIVLLLMLAFGMLSGFMAHAQPQGECGDLGTPVDVACHVTNPDGSTTDCLLWVAGGTDPSGTLGVCNNPPA